MARIAPEGLFVMSSSLVQSKLDLWTASKYTKISVPDHAPQKTSDGKCTRLPFQTMLVKDIRMGLQLRSIIIYKEISIGINLTTSGNSTLKFDSLN
ncbi:hypothetical protein YC2023_106094 [Brassica napus]